MRTNSIAFRKALEMFWPVAVLVILLLYSYARFFLAPYVGFQFNASTGRISDVFVSQSGDSHLELGNQLVSVNGYAFSDYQRDLHINLYQDVQPGQSIPVVAQGESGIKTISWQVTGFTRTEFFARLLNTWLLSYIFWLAGTLTLLLIRPKDERWVSLIAFFYVTAIWLIAGSLSATRLWFSPLVLRAAIWMTLPIYLHLHWNFPRPLGRVPLRLWTLFYIVGAGLAAMQWTGLLPIGAYILPFGLAVVSSALLLFLRFAFRAEERREIGLLFLALLFAFGPAVIIAVLSAEQIVSTVSGGYLFSLLVVPGAYFYVVYRRQLGGSELRANRLISLYLFFIFLLTLFVALLPLFSAQLGSSEAVGAAILITGIVASLLGIFGFPFFQQFVERRLLRISLPPDRLLPTFAGRISTSFTEEHLVDILQREVLPSLLIRQSALLRWYAGKSEATPVYLQGLTVTELPDSKRMKELVARLSAKSGPVISQAEGWLRLAVPVSVGGELLGLWLLGRKDPDDYYSYAEQDLLSALSDQMAIALVNISQAQNLRGLYQTDIGRQEEERVHLARELHDDILRQINELATEAGEQIQSKDFDIKHHSLDDRVRALIHGLRPPMLNYGLYHALHELVDDLADKAGEGTHFELNLPVSEARFDPQVELFVYRIVQQACENALEHGCAGHIWISGESTSTSIDLQVVDDGRGFRLNGGTDLAQLLASRHFGLASMKERAALIQAKLDLQSVPGKGTQIRLHWHPPENKKFDI